MNNKDEIVRNEKRGFWARETPHHYCTACGAPAPAGADGGECLTDFCPNCHKPMVLAPETDIGARFQEFTLVYDTKKIQDLIVSAVCREVDKNVETIWHDTIVEALKERCKEIESEVVTELDDKKRTFVEEMTKRAVNNQCEMVVAKEVGKEVRTITKEIISEMKEQLENKVRTSLQTSFGKCYE